MSCLPTVCWFQSPCFPPGGVLAKSRIVLHRSYRQSMTWKLPRKDGRLTTPGVPRGFTRAENRQPAQWSKSFQQVQRRVPKARRRRSPVCLGKSCSRPIRQWDRRFRHRRDQQDPTCFQKGVERDCFQVELCLARVFNQRRDVKVAVMVRRGAAAKGQVRLPALNAGRPRELAEADQVKWAESLLHGARTPKVVG